MTILALDIAGKTGWAVSEDGETIADYGTVDLFPSGCAPLSRWRNFHRWLRRQVHEREVTEIAYEAVQFVATTQAGQVWAGYKAMLEFYCHAHPLPLTGRPVATIKKRVTGKGNADKKAMVQAVVDLGFEPGDDNAADAIAVMICHIDPDGKPGGTLL